MSEARLDLFPIATARNVAEAIRIQMLLDRTDLPYRMHGANLYGIYGNAAIGFVGPMEFLVPCAYKEQAEACMMELFEVQVSQTPLPCPACDTIVSKGIVDCPNCGLFLG